MPRMASPSRACSPPKKALLPPRSARKLCARNASRNITAVSSMDSALRRATSARMRMISAIPPRANPSERCGPKAVSPAVQAEDAEASQEDLDHAEQHEGQQQPPVAGESDAAQRADRPGGASERAGRGH